VSIVALITDFGTKDGFVGAMKGVMLSINPNLRFVDITHEITPFEVLEGALILKAHYKYFPKDTIFLCVIDPGVGSEREPVAVRCGDYLFVGPKNGIFDLTLREINLPIKAHRIERYTLPRINETFHGRDIFSPACAYLSLGTPLEEIGKEISYKFLLPWEEPKEEGERIIGKIIHFDRFGNGITNVPCGKYKRGVFRDKELRVVSFFLEQKERGPAFVCGSFGYMELFIPMGNAKEELKVRKGEEVILYKS